MKILHNYWQDENRYHEDIFGITLRTEEIHRQKRESARFRMSSIAQQGPTTPTPTQPFPGNPLGQAAVMVGGSQQGGAVVQSGPGQGDPTPHMNE